MHSPFRIGVIVVCAIGLCALVSGCDSGGSNHPRTVTGSWGGTVDTDSVTYELTFDLARAEDSEVTDPRLVGEGELAGEQTWSFQIPDGSFVEPTLSLTLNLRFDESPRPILLEGTVGDEYREVSAQLSGGTPRFDETSITLTRQ